MNLNVIMASDIQKISQITNNKNGLERREHYKC